MDLEGGGLLHYAACSPFADSGTFETPINSGLDVNARDHYEHTPLRWVARGSRSWENLEVLLKANADANARDNEGRTPLHYATPLTASPWKGLYQGIKDLLRAGVSVSMNIIEVHLPNKYRYLDAEAPGFTVKYGAKNRTERTL